MNLFELFVKIGVDDQASDKISDLSSKLGNGLKTAAKIGVAAVGAAATGIAALTKSAVENYAEYEQLVGGVETLFKDSAGIVQEYAANAYKTAGLSANEYMETVTSFSASLLQSLGEDTELSAEYADRAVTDMSDNANKMGTSMEMIQNAYQGFAKQNYTMLDNLKLGYGGTKEEMQRLIKDAASLKDVQAELGVTVDKNSLSFGNIVNAISVMQSKMGIAGTTSKEAFETISGSIASMKSAWSNLVTGLADDEADFNTLMDNFVGSVTTVADNIAPRIGIALNGVAELIKEIVPVAMQYIPQIITEFLPKIAESAVGIVSSISNAILENLDQTLGMGIGIVEYLKNGIIENLPMIVESASEIVLTLSGNIIELSGLLAEAAYELVDALGNELSERIPGLSVVFENLETVVISLTAAMVAYKTASAISGIIDTLRKATEGQTIAQMLLNAVMNANPFVLVTTLVVGLVAAVITLWNTNEDFRVALIDIWNNIKKTFSDAWNFIVSVWNQAKPYFEAIWGAIKITFSVVKTVLGEFFSSAWYAIQGVWNVATGYFSNVWNTIKGIFSAVESVLRGDFEGAWNAIKNVLSGWRSFFQGLFDEIGQVFSGIWGVFENIGSNAIEALKQGISNAWGGIVSWFNGLWNSLFGNRSVSVNADVSTNGSHAGGLAYVPFDGYIAELHKGERVLTASEAKAYKDGEKSSGGGVTVIQNIYSQAKTAADLMLEARHQQERAVLLGV